MADRPLLETANGAAYQQGVDDNIRVAERHDSHRPADINRNRWRDPFGKPANPGISDSGRSGWQSSGLLKLLLGFVRPAFAHQDLRKASMGFGALGVDSQGRP